MVIHSAMIMENEHRYRTAELVRARGWFRFRGRG
jgi:hypothetical protein